MTSLLNTWNALTIQRRVFLIAAVIGAMVAVAMVARLAAQPSMSLLYGGLDPKNSGEVVAALEGMGVAVEVRGDSIYVPTGERDRVRLALARDGLPERGQDGYELLDNLSGFGTTSEMFNAALWRAREGELARTILSVPGVRSARVHIGAAARRAFARGDQKPTAAVTVRMSSSALSDSAALSIRYLVALAVPGLDPAQVAVIDAENGVVLRPGEDRAGALVDRAERRGDKLKAELEALLSVRVGAGNARVSVTVETTSESQTVSERILDPDSQVTMNSQVEETTSTNKGGAGAVTVASNLPDGDAAGGSTRESSESQNRETVSYQYSETRRDQVTQAGAVKRVGVAVLINDARAVAEDGTVTYAQRAPEELAAIEDLVKSAIAFDAERGDTVTVESMRFVEDPGEGTLAEASPIERALADNLPTFLQLGVLALVALALGLFVVRPILTSGARQEQDAFEAEALSLDGEAPADTLESAPAALGATDDPLAVAPMAVGATEPDELAADVETAEQIAARVSAEDNPERDLFTEASKVKKSTIDALRALVKARGDQSTDLLKAWLNEPNTDAKPAWKTR